MRLVIHSKRASEDDVFHIIRVISEGLGLDERYDGDVPQDEGRAEGYVGCFHSLSATDGFV